MAKEEGRSEDDLNEEEESEEGSEEESEESEEETEEENEESEEEEQITLKKSDYDKLLTERENYKKGLLSTKAKVRTLQGTKQEKKEVDITEKKVLAVLQKTNEKKALALAVDDKSDFFIPELVDADQYNEIVGYFPRNVDKSSVETIHKAWKTAVAAWKFDRGIVDKKKEKDSTADIAAMRTKGSDSGESKSKEEPKKKILNTGSTDMKSWYS